VQVIGQGDPRQAQIKANVKNDYLSTRLA